MTSTHPELQNWAGGGGNLGMNFRFAKIHKKAQEQKMAEKFGKFEKFEKKKNQTSALFSSPETS